MLRWLIFSIALVSCIAGDPKAEGRYLYILDAPNELPPKISLDLSKSLWWNGPQSVYLSILLNRDSSLPGEAVLLFSGVSIDRDFSLIAINTVDHLTYPDAETKELRIVLPGFHPTSNKPAIHFHFVEPHTDLERIKNFIGSDTLPQMQAVTGVQKISIFVPEPLDELKAFEAEAIRLYPSLLDYGLSYWFLVGLLIFLPLWTLKHAYYRLQARFLIIFLLPSLLLLSWFVISHRGLMGSVQKNLLIQARLYLENSTKQLTLASEDVEAGIATELKLLVSEKTNAFLEDLYLRQYSLDENPWYDKILHESLHPMDQWLKSSFASKGIQVIFRNDHTSFATPVFYPDHTTRTFHTPVLQRMLRSQLADYNENYLEEQKENMEITNLLRKDLATVFRDSSSVDAFLYNPWKLFDYMPIAYFSKGFKYSKSFWAYLKDTKNNIWLIIGSVEEKRVLDTLRERLLTRLEKMQDESLHVCVIGHHQTVSGRIRGPIADFMAHNAAQSWIQRVASFSMGRNEGDLRFSLSVPSPLIPDMILAVSMSLKSYLEFRQRSFNLLYIAIVSFCAILFLLCRWMAQLVLKPLSLLRLGLVKVQSGDLSQDLPKTGTDELADLSVRFNQMIQYLREKELVSRFLSNMALQSLNQKDHESVREEATVLFCAPASGTDFEDIEQIAEFLPKLHQIIHRNGGMVDKFTGFASLSLFRKNSQTTLPLKACVEIRNLVESGFPHLKICIGLATGDLVLGHVGASLRKDFTCIGNTVNVAARLQSLPPRSGSVTIYLCERTQKNQPSEASNIRQLDSVSLKGKTDLVSVFVHL